MKKTKNTPTISPTTVLARPSNLRTEIGKITGVRFGSGGYQDCMFGLSVDLGSKKNSWGVGDFKGTWGPEISSKDCEWTEKDRSENYASTMRFIADLMQKAKVSEVHDLVGIPVEVVFDGNMLKSWRILEEVI